MYHEFSLMWKSLLEQGLKEDGWPWDWTTLGLGAVPHLRVQILAKSQGIWAAESLLAACLEMAHSIQVEHTFTDGMPFQPGDVLMQCTGTARELFAFERPFLNLAAYISGIATKTRHLVNQVQIACPSDPPRITLTRKTLPGYRDIAIYGVRVGGGYPHRVSLSGGVLIKENHISAAGSLTQAVQCVRKTAPHGCRIEVEVRSQPELQEALHCRADAILLDNFAASEVRQILDDLILCIPAVQRPWIEVSGGLNENNIKEYAIAGVDVLSLGALTHTVSPVDLSLLVLEQVC